MNGKHLAFRFVHLILVAIFLEAGLEPCLAAKKSTGEFTTEDFFRYRQHYNFNLSRDGKKVSYVMRKKDKTYLNIYHLEKKKTISVYIGNDPELYVNFLEWASADRLIISIDDRSLLGVSADGEDVKVLLKWFSELGTDPDILDMLVHDPEHILVAVDNVRGTSAIYKVNVYKGNPKLVYEDLRGVYGWLTDQRGELRAGLVYQNRSARLQIKDIKGNKWNFIDNIFINDNQMKFDYDAKALTNRHCILLGFDYDPNILYFGSNLENDTIGIYAYDLEKQEIIEKIAEHADFDLANTDSGRDTSVLRFCRVKRELVGFNTYFNNVKTIWLDSDYQAVQSMVDQALPQKQNYIQDWNDDGRVFLIRSFESSDPGRYYTLNLNENQLIEIAPTMPWFDPDKMSKKLGFKIDSRDGYKLHGYLTIPASKVNLPLPMNLPMVVYPHGGPWVRDYNYFEPLVQLLSHHGFAVLQVNYRGSTGYGFKHFEGARQDFGVGIQNDITDVVKWAVENGVADPKRIGIMGASYGGYATLMGLTHNPDLYQCGVAIAGVYDLKTQMVDYVAGGRGHYMAYEYWKSMVGDPKKGRNKLEEISPINHVEKLRAPILVVHGEHDNVVSIGQSQALVRELKKADKAFAYIPVKEEGHGRWEVEASVKTYDQILAFLDENLN